MPNRTVTPSDQIPYGVLGCITGGIVGKESQWARADIRVG